MKAIVSAYAVKPYGGSEPGLGWNWIRYLSKSLEYVLVVTESEFKAEILNWVKDKNITNVEFEFISVGKLGRRLCWNQGSYLFYLFYRFWQLKAYRTLRCRDLSKFDYVHHLNMIGYREPGVLHKLNLPFILGPLGGLNDVSPRYLNGMSTRERFVFNFKRRINFLSLYSPYVKSAIRNSSLIFAANSESLKALEKFGVSSVLLNETGIDNIYTKSSDCGQSNRILWVGKLVHRKMPLLALEIFSDLSFKYPELKLEFLGSGPLLRDLEIAIDRYNLGSKVELKGNVERNAVLDLMKDSLCLLFTSIDEGTPHVLLEAISCSLPTFVHDSCGMGDIVRDEKFKIKPVDFETSRHEFVKKIENFILSGQLPEQEIDSLLWANKIEYFLSLVKDKLNR